MLHIPCWLRFVFVLFVFYLGDFSDTSRPGLFCFLIGGLSVTHPLLASLLSRESRAGFNLISGLSLTHPMPISFLSGEFLLHIPCWLHYYFRSFSYTSPAEVIFNVGVSLTRPVLALLLLWGVSLTNPMLASFYTPGSFSCTSSAGLIFIWGVLSYTSHADYFYLGGFSYTSRAGIIFMCGVSLTHSILDYFSFLFIRGVSLTHPALALLFCGEFLLHIPCWLHFISGEFLLHIPCWL